MLPVRSRLSHLLDAVTLGESVSALVILALVHASALDAIGAVFAVPLILAAIGRIWRGVHFALTGRMPRVGAMGRLLDPPARLGRPSWERQPNVGRAVPGRRST